SSWRPCGASRCGRSHGSCDAPGPACSPKHPPRVLSDRTTPSRMRVTDRLNAVTDETAARDLTTAGKLADLKVRYHEAVTASGEVAIAEQAAQRKKTARERSDHLPHQG